MKDDGKKWWIIASFETEKVEDTTKTTTTLVWESSHIYNEMVYTKISLRYNNTYGCKSLGLGGGFFLFFPVSEVRFAGIWFVSIGVDGCSCCGVAAEWFENAFPLSSKSCKLSIGEFGNVSALSTSAWGMMDWFICFDLYIDLVVRIYFWLRCVWNKVIDGSFQVRDFSSTMPPLLFLVLQ